MTRLVVIIGFVVSFSAGLMVGLSRDRGTRAGAPPSTRPSHRDGWLTSELNLSPRQQEEMRKIWSETAGKGRGEQEDRRRQLRRERDEAIAALVRPEDYDKYDQILKLYNDQVAVIDQEMRESFKAAVEKTKPLLTPEQRAKYQEILNKHQWDRGPRDGNRDRPLERNPRQGDAGATSKPSSYQ